MKGKSLLRISYQRNILRYQSNMYHQLSAFINKFRLIGSVCPHYVENSHNGCALPLFVFKMFGMCKLYSSDRAVIQTEYEKIFSTNQLKIRLRLQQCLSILYYYLHPLEAISHLFVAGLVTKVGGTLVVAFTIFRLFKAYKVRQNDLKRRCKQANKESSLRRIKEKCKHIQVGYVSLPNFTLYFSKWKRKLTQTMADFNF